MSVADNVEAVRKLTTMVDRFASADWMTQSRDG